jgi:hypothetical protein
MGRSCVGFERTPRDLETALMILSSARHARHIRHCGLTRPPARRKTERASGLSRGRARTDPAERGERPPELGGRATSNRPNAPVHLRPSAGGVVSNGHNGLGRRSWFSHQSAKWRATLAGSVSTTPVGAAGCETLSSIRQLATKTRSRAAIRLRTTRSRAQVGCLGCCWRKTRIYREMMRSTTHNTRLPW